jgi:hypothetical protein
MSEITAELAREVLALAIAHCPADLAEVLRLHNEALDSVSDLTRGQLSGPDTVPASVVVAFGRFDEALRDLSLDIEDYATAMDAKVALA